MAQLLKTTELEVYCITSNMYTLEANQGVFVVAGTIKQLGCVLKMSNIKNMTLPEK